MDELNSLTPTAREEAYRQQVGDAPAAPFDIGAWYGKLRGRLIWVAQKRYGIQPHDAEDALHNAMATYMEIGGRYPADENHGGIATGIFYKKCLEHIDRSAREQRKLQRAVGAARAGRNGSSAVVLDGEMRTPQPEEELMEAERSADVRAALAALSSEHRELVGHIANGASRQELIERYGVCKNTFDTRLRNLRLKLVDALIAEDPEYARLMPSYQ